MKWRINHRTLSLSCNEKNKDKKLTFSQNALIQNMKRNKQNIRIQTMAVIINRWFVLRFQNKVVSQHDCVSCFSLFCVYFSERLFRSCYPEPSRSIFINIFCRSGLSTYIIQKCWILLMNLLMESYDG